jgi:sugar/nucleoside kinase (ribokinase family)
MESRPAVTGHYRVGVASARPSWDGQFDILSVGDITTDAIIRLLPDSATILPGGDRGWLAIPFGAKVPFDDVFVLEAVGNASNAAVGFARLGLRTGLVTNVGGDRHGIEMIHALHEGGVDTRFVRVNPGRSSNYHYALWYDDDRTILTRHEEYDYHWPHLRPAEVPRWLYFSSVSEHALDYHDQLVDWVTDQPGTKLAFQPGTFQLEAGPDRLARLYRLADVVIVNREEAAVITGGNHEDVADLLDRLHDLGPETVVITDGPAGAYASDGSMRLSMPAYPDPGPACERTGAGDAFASAFVGSLAEGRPMAEALRRAPVNSMNVVQAVGPQAGLLTDDEIEALLDKAPGWYRPTPL